MDQDTIVVQQSLDRIIREVNQRFDKVGVIALGDNKTEETSVYRQVRYIKTSGNLVKMEIFDNLRFREEFFMDQVDYDFDYEVINHGYRIILADWYLIDHRLGTKKGKLSSYEPPIRVYYIIRNSTVLLMERKLSLAFYAHQIIGWSLSSIYQDGIITYSRTLITGLIDGLTRKLGNKMKFKG